MNWSEKAWERANPIYEKIIAMPFIEELQNGTLDPKKFKFYIEQDSRYLEYFARALSIIAAKAEDVNTMLDFIRFAEGAIAVERSLHDSYFKQYEVKGQISMSPTCHHYVHFLQSTVYMSQSSVGIAAVLPCFWVYKKIGDYILSNQTKNDNQYQNWIDTYAGDEFGLLVEKAILICDTAAASSTVEQQETMTEVFLTACKLEYNFWDSAYLLEKWK
ncbi:thiaminase II [Arcticibacter eurypsychrophilus]|uniref:thiaminase II n=1 Tax=Arcticibacter eurypsychrophilus TaxID=1434752 RepID=UPI00084D1002|nr:thiaminase II [Arcticibacter eurypsychrophilus]